MSIISSNQLTACKRLLFISPVALGDFLYLKTFLIALKNTYPHIELDIWLDDNRCNDDSWRLSRSQILQQWISTIPEFTRSYGCTNSSSAQQSQIVEAKKMNYELIVCHSGSNSQKYSEIARKISLNAFIVSSIAKSPLKGFINKFIFRHSDKVYKLNANLLSKEHHITDRFYTICHDVFGLNIDKADFMPDLSVPEEVKLQSQQWLSKHLPEPDGTKILINHLSTSKKRDWNESQVIGIIKQIRSHNPTSQFIINVTKENMPSIQATLNAEFGVNESYIAVFTIQEHFFELPSMIAEADFVITVETAIMHFATAANTPLIALMRSKKPYWAPPTTPTSQVLYATEGKGYVSDINVETVFNQYLSMTQ